MLEVPSSTASQYTKVSLDDIVDIAKEQHMHDGYTISIPQEPQGVYTLSVFHQELRMRQRFTLINTPALC
ncbi:hypothetical protein AAAC51_13485 [Priestia megaterium]